MLCIVLAYSRIHFTYLITETQLEIRERDGCVTGAEKSVGAVADREGEDSCPQVHGQQWLQAVACADQEHH